MEAMHPRIVSAPELVGVPLLIYRPPPTFHTAAPRRLRWRRPLSAISFRSSLLLVDDVIGEDVLRAFLKVRQLNGDAISKASDMLWRWGASNFVDTVEDDVPTSVGDLDDMEEENVGGYLKLAKTKEWIMGETTALLNKKLAARFRIVLDDACFSMDNSSIFSR
ncbi:hypothetical protein Taro_045517 [Colocasia esculenta]|uniref:Uncharacterized protein n=1 Tax=Colocasia esculenta TaxID=4460 RepID=A0A843WWS8_COLES|nr:hypothetical protein [Colocasia esculenta]